MSFDLNYVVNNGNYTNANNAGNDISNIFPPSEVHTQIYQYNVSQTNTQVVSNTINLNINTTDYAVFPTFYSTNSNSSWDISENIKYLNVQQSSGSFVCNIWVADPSEVDNFTVVFLIVYNKSNLNTSYNNIN